MTTEEEMRQALFGATAPAERATAPLLDSLAIVVANSPASPKRQHGNSFIPKLIVTLRVGNEYEGKTELLTYNADTLSKLQAEVDAKKIARKKIQIH